MPDELPQGVDERLRNLEDHLYTNLSGMYELLFNLNECVLILFFFNQSESSTERYICKIKKIGGQGFISWKERNLAS